MWYFKFSDWLHILCFTGKMLRIPSTSLRRLSKWQSPSLYFAFGFENCPYETIQIIHSNVHHWILLSSFNGEVKIFDSLNTNPTIETLQQIKQLFSPDNTFPLYQLSPCHKQLSTTDFGVFAIAYSIDILSGNNRSKIIYDQSKLRQHLVNCFE